MRFETRRYPQRQAFTIVELLTIMSIIIIIISILLPGLQRVRIYAQKTKQGAQFHSVSIGLESFYNEWDTYPSSSAVDSTGALYCGSMKMTEALIGQDLRGFHPDSLFRQDGTNGLLSPDDVNFYDLKIDHSDYLLNLKERVEAAIQIESANAYQLVDIYGSGAIGSFDPNSLVMCDEFSRVRHKITNKSIGMPILYYRANTINKLFGEVVAPASNIYNYLDNDDLVQLGLPFNPGFVHSIYPLAGITPGGGTLNAGEGVTNFYDEMTNPDITTGGVMPYRSNSYILMSAGYDGEYGTRDDVFNFAN